MTDQDQVQQPTWDKKVLNLKSQVYDFVINQILLSAAEMEPCIQNLQHTTSSLVETILLENEQWIDGPLARLRLSQTQEQPEHEGWNPNKEIQSLQLSLTELMRGIEGLTQICNEAQNLLRGEEDDWCWGLPNFFDSQNQQLQSISTRLILRLEDTAKFLIEAIKRETEELITSPLVQLSSVEYEARLGNEVLDQNAQIQFLELRLTRLLHKMQGLRLICNETYNILRGELETSAEGSPAFFISQSKLLTNSLIRLVPNLENNVDVLVKAIRLETEESLNGTLARLQLSQDEAQLAYGASNRNDWMKNLELRLTQLVSRMQVLKRICSKTHNVLSGEQNEWARDSQNFFSSQSQLLEKLTTRLVLKSLVLESQPDWIIRKDRIIQSTLRLLPPFCLELGHNLTVNFKVHALNKVDATNFIQKSDQLLGTDRFPFPELHSESVTIRKESIIKLGADSKNKVKVSSVSRVKAADKEPPTKRQRVACGVENDDEKEKKTNKGDSAKDEQFCLLFSFDCLIQGKAYKIWCCSRPFVFNTNLHSQGIVGEAKMFWSMNFPLATVENAFGDHKTVSWPKVAAALNGYFKWKTGTTRNLSPLNLEHLKENLFGKTTGQDLDVTQIQLYTIRDGSPMSFWNWFHCIIDFINDKKVHVKELWEGGLLIGFISNEDVTRALQNEKPGTFLLRFSDSSRRGTTIVYVGDTRILHCRFERDELKVAHKSLVERILVEWNIKKLCYENVEGLTVGDKEEKLGRFQPKDENVMLTSSGSQVVVQAGKRYVVHQGNLPRS